MITGGSRGKGDSVLESMRKSGDFLPINTLDINLGRIGSPYKRVAYLAEMMDVDTTERVIGQGVSTLGIVPTFPATARNFSVASTSANDTLLGTGARTIFIEGLDSNFDTQFEFLDLNGQTEADTLLQYLRVNQVFVKDTGTLRHNDGIIYVSDDTDTFVAGVPQTRVYNIMPTGHSIGKIGLFSVPRNNSLFFERIVINTNLSGAPRITVKLYKTAKNFDSTGNTEYLDNTFILDRSQNVIMTGQPDVDGASDVRLTCQNDTGAAEISVIIHTIRRDDSIPKIN